MDLSTCSKSSLAKHSPGGANSLVLLKQQKYQAECAFELERALGKESVRSGGCQGIFGGHTQCSVHALIPIFHSKGHPNQQTRTSREHIPSLLEVRSGMLVFKRQKNAKLNINTFSKIWFPHSVFQQDIDSSSQLVQDQSKSSYFYCFLLHVSSTCLSCSPARNHVKNTRPQ